MSMYFINLFIFKLMYYVLKKVMPKSNNFQIL